MTLQPTYLDYHRIYVYLNDVRTLIQNNVIENITGKDWGISGSKALDRVGNTGSLEIILNDKLKQYTPGSLTALSGWDEGIPLEMELSFENKTYIYRFYIKNIQPPSSSNDFKTKVTAMDWMHYAREHPIENPGVLTDQKGNEVLTEVLSRMPIQPQAIDFDDGINIFPTAFNVITQLTKAYDDPVNIALSEIGYVYEIYDRQYGETLVFENATSRNGLRSLSVLPLSEEDSGFLQKEDGGYILKEDGGRIILNQVANAVIDNSMIDVDVSYGDNVINHFTGQANPRRLDTSLQILFKLDSPMPLGSGVLIEIKGTYADPAGGYPINAQGLIDPVITTDYLVNSAEDGSGVNISTGLVFETIVLGSDGFTIQVFQTDSSYNGYLTKFNIRGYGIYYYNPIITIARNQESINRRGVHTDTINQKYKDDLSAARIFTEAEVDRERNGRKVLHSVRFCANRSPFLMTAFLNLHPGDLINIVIDKLNIDGRYYIQGIDNVSILTGGLIWYDWILREALSLQSGLSNIAIETGLGNYIDYGYMSHLSNIEQKTISMRVFFTEINQAQVLISQGSVFAAEQLWISESADGKPVYSRDFSVSNGQWITTNDVLTALINTWVMITVTYDDSNASNDPIFYINGSSVAITEFETPSGTSPDETGNTTILGNRVYPGSDYQYGFQGKMKDIRIYNRILTATEITALYNTGTVDNALVTDGLVFQGPAVRTSEYNDYINVALTADQKIIDNIYGAVGTPRLEPTAGTSAPIGRAP